MEAIQILRSNFIKGMQYLVEQDKTEIQDQGHVATGRLRDSVNVKFVFDGDSLRAEFYAEQYGLALDQGLGPDQMRIGWRKWKEVSKGWARIVKPELSEKEIDTFLFFVWRKHKREGMPTRASSRFSKNGRRTGWIKQGSRKAENIDFGINQYLEILLSESYKFLKRVNQAA